MTWDENGIWLEEGEFKPFRKMNWNNGAYYYSIIYVLAVWRKKGIEVDKGGIFNNTDEMQYVKYTKFYMENFNEAVYFTNLSKEEKARYIGMNIDRWAMEPDKYHWFVYKWDGKNYRYEDIDITPYDHKYWIDLNGGDEIMVRKVEK